MPSPATDWKSVDIEGLRQHLIDMDNVTLRAQIVATPTDTGARFEAGMHHQAHHWAIATGQSPHL